MRPDTELDFSRLYVFGTGGHGREVAWIAETAWRSVPEIVFLVNDPRYLEPRVDGHDVRLFDDEELPTDSRFVVALGDPADRRRIVGKFDARSARATTIIAANVARSERVAVGEGSVIFPGCVVTTAVTLGRHVHVNAGCSVSHDSVIGDFSSLSPGVHVAGNVRIGEGVFVGIGASVSNGRVGNPILVGDRSVIAAGACVLGSVEPDSMVAGVPAQKKR